MDAENVHIVHRDDTFTSELRHEISFIGVTASLSGGAADSLNTFLDSRERADETDNELLADLHNWRAANALNDLQQQLDTLQHLPADFANLTEANFTETNKATGEDDTPQTSGINLNISLSHSHSETHQTTTQNSAHGSSINAGGDITLNDRGDTQISGGYLSGDTVTLNTQNALTLRSAENTYTSDSNHNSSSLSGGISIGSDGLALTASASRGHGFTRQSDDQYLETRIHANRQARINSGRQHHP